METFNARFLDEINFDAYWGAPADRAHLSSDPGNKFKIGEAIGRRHIMAEYIEVNGRQIRVRPTETVSEVDKYGNFHRQPNHLQKDSDPGKIRSRKTGTFYSGQRMPLVKPRIHYKGTSWFTGCDQSGNRRLG